jgi:hypothetical protein
MSWFRLRLHRLSWSVWLALSALLLAPTLSHARMPPQRALLALAEICTPQGRGLAAVALPGSDEEVPDMAWHGLAHGACCASGGVLTGMLPSGATGVVPRPVQAGVPAVLYRAPGSLAVRIAAQPRAPPAPH